MTCIHQAKRNCTRCLHFKPATPRFKHPSIRLIKCPTCSGTGKIPQAFKETFKASRRLGGGDYL